MIKGGNSVFTRLKGLSSKDNNSSIPHGKERVQKTTIVDIGKHKHDKDIMELGDLLAIKKQKVPLHYKTYFDDECRQIYQLLEKYIRNTDLPYETRELALLQIHRSSIVAELTEVLMGKELNKKHMDNLFNDRRQIAANESLW